MAMGMFSKSHAECISFCPQDPYLPFVSKMETMYKFDEIDMDKMELIKLEFLMDPDNPYSKCSRYLAIFKERMDQVLIEMT
jgi:hypothetical protein